MPADGGSAPPAPTSGAAAEPPTTAPSTAPADAPIQAQEDMHVSPHPPIRPQEEDVNMYSPSAESKGPTKDATLGADGGRRGGDPDRSSEEPSPKRPRTDRGSNSHRSPARNPRNETSRRERSPSQSRSRSRSRSWSRSRSRSYSRSPSRSPRRTTRRSSRRSPSRSPSRSRSRSRSRDRGWGRRAHFGRREQSPRRSRDGRNPARDRHGGRGGHDYDRGSTPPYKRRRPSASVAETEPRDIARRKPSVSQEERKRGQRLFGGLLSTLGQTTARSRPASGPGRNGGAQRGALVPSGPDRGFGGRTGGDTNESQTESERRRPDMATNKPDEKQTAEDRKKNAERLAKLERIRKIEQIRFDEQKMHTLQANDLALAHSLRTRSRPILYYRPRYLSKDEEQIIENQVQAAKQRASQQKREFEEMKRERLAALGVKYKGISEIPAEPETTQQSGTTEPDADTASLQDADAMADEPPVATADNEKQPEKSPQEEDRHNEEKQDFHDRHDGQHEPQQHNDHDDQDERDKDIMVESEEATVIY